MKVIEERLCVFLILLLLKPPIFSAGEINLPQAEYLALSQRWEEYMYVSDAENIDQSSTEADKGYTAMDYVYYYGLPLTVGGATVVAAPLVLSKYCYQYPKATDQAGA